MDTTREKRENTVGHTAYGIKVPHPVKVRGQHLSDAANEPPSIPTFKRIEADANADARDIVAGFTEEELLQADRERDRRKSDGSADRERDERALRQQQNYLRATGRLE